MDISLFIKVVVVGHLWYKVGLRLAT